jgi:hypothetical protein
MILCETKFALHPLRGNTLLRLRREVDFVANVISNEMQVVVFSLGQVEYGGDINKVQEIIRLPEVTALPVSAGLLYCIDR